MQKRGKGKVILFQTYHRNPTDGAILDFATHFLLVVSYTYFAVSLWFRIGACSLACLLANAAGLTARRPVGPFGETTIDIWALGNRI